MVSGDGKLALQVLSMQYNKARKRDKIEKDAGDGKRQGREALKNLKFGRLDARAQSDRRPTASRPIPRQ